MLVLLRQALIPASSLTVLKTGQLKHKHLTDTGENFPNVLTVLQQQTNINTIQLRGNSHKSREAIDVQCHVDLIKG